MHPSASAARRSARQAEALRIDAERDPATLGRSHPRDGLASRYYFGIARKSDPNAVGDDPVPIRVTARGSVSLTAPANEFDDQIGGRVLGQITAYLGAGGVTIGFNTKTIGIYTGCFNKLGCIVQERIDPPGGGDQPAR